MKTHYFVIDEHTLTAWQDHWNKDSHQILRASILKGSPYSWMSGSISVFGCKVRPATEKDFKDFRVSLPFDFKQIK